MRNKSIRFLILKRLKSIMYSTQVSNVYDLRKKIQAMESGFEAIWKMRDIFKRTWNSMLKRAVTRIEAQGEHFFNYLSLEK